MLVWLTLGVLAVALTVRMNALRLPFVISVPGFTALDQLIRGSAVVLLLTAVFHL